MDAENEGSLACNCVSQAVIGFVWLAGCMLTSLSEQMKMCVYGILQSYYFIPLFMFLMRLLFAFLVLTSEKSVYTI